MILLPAQPTAEAVSQSEEGGEGGDEVEPGPAGHGQFEQGEAGADAEPEDAEDENFPVTGGGKTGDQRDQFVGGLFFHALFQQFGNDLSPGTAPPQAVQNPQRNSFERFVVLEVGNGGERRVGHTGTF